VSAATSNLQHPTTNIEPSPQRESVNPTPLLCREHVREFLLDAARRHRPFNKFSRVSEQTLVAINAKVRAICVSRVKQLPSKGVTI
jgi:hypothetical protein